MPMTESFNVSLPHDLADLIESKIRSGEYADEGDVIRAGLRSLATRDAAVEAWLRDEVVPTYDAALAEPGRSLSADEAWSRLNLHMTGGASRPSGA